MAAQNSRTVTLTLDTQTTGLDGVKNLSDHLKQLAKQGGDAAPEFAKLAGQLDEAIAAEEKQAASVKKAADALNSAKTQLLDARAAVSAYTASIGGARKANAEQAAELERLNQAVRESKAGVDAAKAAISAATPEYHRLAQATQQITAAAEQMTQAVKKPGQAAEESAKKTDAAFSGTAEKLRGLAGPIIAAFGAGEFWKANTNVESLRRTLELLTGSSEAAAKEIEYLRGTANRLGLDVQDASKAYISLTAAAKGTALEGQGTREIFEAVAGAMSKLGKSSADTEGALQAVSQMMSKGVVSMEEMRQQLGERLPGAMQATADAAGMTVAELTDMIGTGQVLAVDLLPKLAEGLRKVYATGGQADGMAASWNRLKNSITDTMTFIGDSGVAAGITALLGQVAIAVRGLVGAFDLLGRSIGITLGAIVSFDFSNWGSSIAQAAADIQKKLDAANTSAKQTAAGQGQLADASRSAATAADNQAVSWLTVVNAYVKVNKAAKEAVDLAEKNQKAVEAESKASAELAAAFGTESEKRQAAANAAEQNAAALKQLADARRIDAETANSNTIALQEAAKAEGKLSEEKRKAIEAAQNAATAKKSEADQATAAALSAQQHAAALTVEAAALTDNSGKVKQLKATHEQVAAALETVRAARAAGNATIAQEQAAAIEAGKAAALYRDALKDQTEAIAGNAKVKAAQFDVDSAGIKLAIEQQRTIWESAKARGDEYTAVIALTEIKKLEVQLAELTAKAKRAEAAAALEMVKAKREELQASGQLTAAKELELKAQEAGAQVKMKEADIAQELAKRSKEMADAFIYGAGGARELAGALGGIGESAQSSVSGVDALTASVNRLRGAQAGGGNGSGNTTSNGGLNNAELAQRAAELGITLPMDSSSFLDGGERSSRGVSARDMLYKSGATIEQAAAAEKFYGELFQRKYMAGSSAVRTTDDNNRLIAQASKEAATEAIRLATIELSGGTVDLGPAVSEVARRNLALASNRDFGPNSDTAFAAMRESFAAAGREMRDRPATVNITVGGKSQKVNVSSEGDANGLVNILKHLEKESARY